MIDPYLSAVKNKQFRTLWLGQIISQIALNMLSFVLAIQVYTLTRSNAAVSFMLLTFGIPAIIFGTLAGSVVDHFDKRKVMMLCNFARGGILILFFLFAKNIYALYFLSIIMSVLTQFFIPAEAPSIPKLVRKDLLLTANSLFTISFSLSTVLGFILAGPAIATFGYQYVYLVMSSVMFLAWYFAFQLPSLKGQESGTFRIGVAFVTKNVSEVVTFIRTHTRIEQSLILTTLSQALVATLVVLAPGFADRVLTIVLTDASYIVMGPGAVGLVLGAYWVGAYGIRFLKGSIILSGILATGATLILLSFITSANKPSLLFSFVGTTISISNLIVAILLLFFLGVFNSFISVPANTILLQESKSDMRGRIYGILTSLTGGVSVIPVIFSGLLADAFGVERAFFVIGIIVLAAGVYHYLRRRKIPSTIIK